MEKCYFVIRKVIKAHGTQTFTVDAESYEEAVRKVLKGEGRFDDEFIEVNELSTSCEVYLPDDLSTTIVYENGKMRRPNLKNQWADQ